MPLLSGQQLDNKKTRVQKNPLLKKSLTRVGFIGFYQVLGFIVILDEWCQMLSDKYGMGK